MHSQETFEAIKEQRSFEHPRYIQYDVLNCATI